ncbi:MAG: 50S ribosomal protein L15 [Candidatus Neomarinimicrobiota bacterium]|nr:MAG: 50S ribosomal protein L15 [Candidatus Neomarinimicrobiota bacterium]
MNLGSLEYAPGSRKDRKRLGRGNASGTGGTSGRGHKGYGSRSGSKSRGWMEGGTMPLYRRVPKRGFTNIFKEKFQIVNLDVISRLQLPEVTVDTLFEKGIIKSLEIPVKILGNGEVKNPVSVIANAFSKSAKEKIESAGGKAKIV